ncbi:MAG: pyrroline-5-carboxylate reductase [Dehalococcoidia bacterium]|nr:MAG: pyrroline-5-carboxylate reductase [Dehalococcoidia bacterium]
MKIAFIGGGVMGEIILSAILDKGLSTPQAISVSDIKKSRRQHLQKKYGVTVTDSNRLAAGGDVVVLAVKPQDLTTVMAELNGQLKAGQLVLSIIAGARINTLCLGLNHNQVVRVMPNTPAQIGQGISVWTATAEVSQEQKEQAGSILKAMGRELYVADEKYIDMATAVSGSGPAYIFLFIESLVAAAVNIGLPADIAKELVLETILGSGNLVQKSGKEPARLRKMVTSPGGVTAEALNKLEKGGFAELVLEAVVAAYNKARRLGD